LNYIELKIDCQLSYREILIAELDRLNFESFLEHDHGILAYISESNFDQGLISLALKRYKPNISNIKSKSVENKNWNQKWEKNYEPILVEDQCIIKASFHKIEKNYSCEIIIDPKMSFGTGHHETTYLMLKNQLSYVHLNKKVLDAGCGTGVLSIYASKNGALSVTALDIDDWAIENTRENILVNDCRNIQVCMESIKEHKNKDYDLLLANINKNVLIEESALYYAALVSGGSLFLSGFYQEDLSEIENIFKKHSFRKTGQSIRNNWASLLFKKD